MAERCTIIHRDELIDIQVPLIDKQFQSYDGKFKHIPITLSPACPLDVQYRSIMRYQNTAVVKTPHLLRYLYDFALEHMKVLGIMTVDGVAVDQHDICPSHLFEVKIEGNLLDPEGGDPPSVEKKNSLALLILTRVRYCKVPEGETFDTMRNGLSIRVKSLIDSDSNLEEVIGELPPTAPAKSAYANDTMLRMLAAYDWFLFPRPDHHLSTLRFGTLSTRYYGMTFYDSLMSIVHQSSFSLQEFVSFMLHPLCQEEMYVFFKAMGKTECFEGLFPYQKSIGIVNKSVFSVQACPNTHTFLSAIGIFRGNARCINARAISNVEVIELGFHAAAMVNTVSGTYGQVYFPTIADRDIKNRDLDLLIDDEIEAEQGDAPANQGENVAADAEDADDMNEPPAGVEDDAPNLNDQPVPAIVQYSAMQLKVEEYMKVLRAGDKEEQFKKVYFPGNIIREGTIAQYLKDAVKEAKR